MLTLSSVREVMTVEKRLGALCMNEAWIGMRCALLVMCCR